MALTVEVSATNYIYDGEGGGTLTWRGVGVGDGPGPGVGCRPGVVLEPVCAAVGGVPP